MPLRALASINLAAVERNVARLCALSAPAAMCVVVKADGYGHGAVPVARSAVEAGARWLAVATAAEAAELRAAGLGVPLLVMGALTREELPVALQAQADVVAWSEEFLRSVEQELAPEARGRIHVKLDTGMGRLGTRDPEFALALARAVARHPRLILAGAMTHFATADEDPAFMAGQLESFRTFAEQVRTLAPEAIVHAANSAATVREPRAHLDMVRCGIAVYGCDPLHEDAAARGLEPAMTLTSYLAAVKPAEPGQSTGYGRRFIAADRTWIGTAPIGYGDGVRRGLTNNCDVLIRGRRYPLVGTVSMDNITIDLGPQPVAAVGDPVTIIGADGEERQSAEDLGRRLGTINYEVVCGISSRVPRHHHRDGEAV